MTAACQEGRMPWPCRLAWGLSLATCVSLLALVLVSLRPASGTAATGPSPAPDQEPRHAQP